MPTQLPDTPTTPHPRFRAPWRRAVVFLLLAAAVVAGGVGVVLLLGDHLTSGRGWVIVSCSGILAAIGGYLIMVRLCERRRPTELGLRRAPGDLLGGLLVGATLALICGAAVWLLGGATLTGVRSLAGTSWPWTVLSAGVFAGIVEEIGFRGVLLRLVEQRFGTWIALALSSAIFGIAHITTPGATILSCLAIVLEAGLLLGMVYILTRSLWWAIGVHAAWNLTIGLILGSAVSGNASDSLLQVTYHGSDLLTGGTYGLEASLVTVVILTAVAVAGLWWAQRRGRILSRRSAHALTASAPT